MIVVYWMTTNNILGDIMPEFKISNISKNLNFPHGKAKRYTREFLDPDPSATLQSGHARSLDTSEVYTIFLAYHLVSKHKFSIPETKKIMRDLKSWLVKRNLFPGAEGSAESEKPKVRSWKITIQRTDKFCQFNYMAEGLIQQEPHGKYTAGNNTSLRIWRKEIVQFPILPDDVPEGRYMIDEFNLQVLRISYLSEIFKLRMEGKSLFENAERWVEYRTF